MRPLRPGFLIYGLTEFRKKLFNVCVRTRNYVKCYNFAELLSCVAASFNSCFNCANVAANHYAYESGTDLFASYENYVSCFYHCVCCFDSCNKTSCFYHAECFHFYFLHVLLFLFFSL